MSFDLFHVSGGDVIAVLTLIVLFLGYRLDTKKRSEAEQQKHDDNLQRLNTLTSFHQDQKNVNEETETKLDQLKTQTSTISTTMTGIAATMAGIDRRTTRIENQLDRSHS